MLDRTNFASWQQRIHLYCRGKETMANILKYIYEGPFKMGTFRETLSEGNEGALHLGPERPRVYYDLLPEEKERFITTVKLNRGLRDSNYDQLYAYLKQHEAHANENKMMLDRFTQHTVDPLALMSNVSHQQYYPQSSTTPQNQATVQDGKVVVQNVQSRQTRGQGNNALGAGATGYGGRKIELGMVALDEEQLLFITGGQDNVVDEDVDEQPVQDLALNMDNVFQADDCEAFDSNVNEAPTAQTMFMANLSFADPVYDEAGPSYDLDILPETAKFELTEREQKIDEQLKIVITDLNIKEENLKKELHSVKMQLTSTINLNKSMVEEVTSLKEDFKQKENKYLEEFLDMKALKEKVKDKSYKQDQSLQTVYMLCKPMPYYDEHSKVQSRGNTIRELREKISRLTKKHSDADPIHDLKELDSQNKELHVKVNALHDLNEQNHKSNFVAMPAVKLKVLDPGIYVIDVEPIPPRNKNNREVHLDYLKHLKESVATLREIVEEARVEKPFDSSLASACHYMKHSQELVEDVIGTCPNDFNKRDKQIASTTVTRKKRVTFMHPCETSTHNNLTHVKKQTMNKTNEPVVISQ
uniref:Integrase, catalytic region, zinc finger, CCHC-type, peptidase aspartic, catalytic n=1 Tax=Tanacetum cinerariifolium TaxID=118510 RepID=A0A6L2J0U5_TANCI|nr:hypothetical protein [Tanacetum cinerariifolium]